MTSRRPNAAHPALTRERQRTSSLTSAGTRKTAESALLFRGVRRGVHARGRRRRRGQPSRPGRESSGDAPATPASAECTRPCAHRVLAPDVVVAVLPRFGTSGLKRPVRPRTPGPETIGGRPARPAWPADQGRTGGRSRAAPKAVAKRRAAPLTRTRPSPHSAARERPNSPARDHPLHDHRLNAEPADLLSPPLPTGKPTAPDPPHHLPCLR